MGTIRFRLTFWYAASFLVAGLIMLVLVNVLVERAIPATDPGFIQRVANRPATEAFRSDLEEMGVVPPRPSNGRNPPPVTTGPRRPSADRQIEAILGLVEQGRIEARDDALGTLLVQSSLALGVLLVLSVGEGWMVAGRMLRPIAEITGAVQRIDAARLDGRIALSGPRDEIRALADEFDAMLDRLDATFRAQRDFVANASHELRTPLAVMRTELEVTFSDPDVDPDTLLASAETIRRAITRSDELISALLTLERADAPRQVAEEVDLATTVRNVLSRHTPIAEEQNIDIALDLDPALTSGDPMLIERLVENLVANAIAYNEGENGQQWIRVSTAADTTGVYLTVANSSGLFDSARLDALFDRFHRAESSRSRETGGYGLGLAIVRAVARHHGGEASARTISGADGHPGLEFVVRLPVRR